MDITQALATFSALSQETRLRAFRLLVQAGSAGAPAGALSDALGTPHNTLSFHLNQLAHAGIVSSRRDGRSVIYAANVDATRDLIGFLVKVCCSADLVSIREDTITGNAVIELPPAASPATTQANADQRSFSR